MYVEDCSSVFAFVPPAVKFLLALAVLVCLVLVAVLSRPRAPYSSRCGFCCRRQGDDETEAAKGKDHP